MKKFMLFITMLFTLFVFDTYILDDTVFNMYEKYTNKDEIKIVSNKELLDQNKYHKSNPATYVKETDDLIAKNKDELINIYYTAVNRGYDKITFYCSENYNNCFEDINKLDSDTFNFSYVNQLVNVYNSYSSIESIYSSNQRVDINIEKRYNEEKIKLIDSKVESILSVLDINSYSNVKDKIKIIHDYLINNNSYDIEMANNKTSDYESDSAYGALFQGKAICSGYTDAMALFLDKLSLTNVRVASDEHVWNAVLIGDNWYHIDLTWDDPVVSDGSNALLHDYFLITTKELESKEKEEHNFNKDVYNFL